LARHRALRHLAIALRARPSSTSPRFRTKIKSPQQTLGVFHFRAPEFHGCCTDCFFDVYTDFTRISTFDAPSQELEGIPELVLKTGEHVNNLGDGKYQVVETGDARIVFPLVAMTQRSMGSEAASASFAGGLPKGGDLEPDAPREDMPIARRRPADTLGVTHAQPRDSPKPDLS